MPDPTSPQPPTGRVVAWYTGIGLPEYNITDYTDPNIPDWSGEEKWKIQAKYFAPWLVGGLVLLFPIVGFVIWWCVKRRGSKKLEWTRELRQKEAAVRKEVEENKEKTRKEDKALAKQKKKEKKERARAKVAQEKEKEKAIKKLAKERFVQGSSLTTEGEDFSKDGGVSGGISTGTSDKTKGLAT